MIEANENDPLNERSDNSYCLQQFIVASIGLGTFAGGAAGGIAAEIVSSAYTYAAIWGGVGVGFGVGMACSLGACFYKNPPSCAFFKSETPSAPNQEENIFNPVSLPGQDL